MLAIETIAAIDADRVRGGNVTHPTLVTLTVLSLLGTGRRAAAAVARRIGAALYARGRARVERPAAEPAPAPVPVRAAQAAAHLRAGGRTACGLPIDGDVEHVVDSAGATTCARCTAAVDIADPRPLARACLAAEGAPVAAGWLTVPRARGILASAMTQLPADLRERVEHFHAARVRRNQEIA